VIAFYLNGTLKTNPIYSNKVFGFLNNGTNPIDGFFALSIFFDFELF
jgi:hypothetical protein